MKLLFSALIKFILGIVLVGACLFLPAWTFNYPGAWLFICLLFVPMLVMGVVMLIKAPKLLEKRLDNKEKEKTQKGITKLLGLMFLVERLIPEVGLDKGIRKNMLFWSVTFHNLPEGMAVGVLYAAAINDNSPQILGAAISLSIGIAIQNFPEGAIISMPLRGNGISKHKAFGLGVLSGIVEPIGAILTILAVSFILPILPILLGIAAGAMIFAILKELQPSIILNNGENIGTIFFAIGFSCMMALDVALG